MYLKKHEQEYLRELAEKMLGYKTWKEDGRSMIEILDKLDKQRKDYNEYMHGYLKKKAFKGGKKK